MRLLVTTLALASFFFFFFNLCEVKANNNGTHASTPPVPAVIVFGDSIMDPGNNNAIKTIIKCNFPPYGVNFTGHKPTGRFCNGKIPTDFIASKLGIKEYLPAYVGANLSPEDLITGVSFASGGAGYDPLTSQAASAISLDQQLKLFKEYSERVRGIVGPERAATILAESLYIICTGTDDIANTYFPTPLRKTMYDPPSYANLLVGYASQFLQELLNLGVRKIGVVGMPPVGCLPSQRTLGGGILRTCADPQNQLARLFNTRMDAEATRLKHKNPRTLLEFGDIYGILYDIIENPYNYGFKISNRGCCGTGKLEVAVLCNSFSSSICDDVSNYVFWDSYHPTEKAYKVIVDFLYEKYIHLLI